MNIICSYVITYGKKYKTAFSNFAPVVQNFYISMSVRYSQALAKWVYTMLVNPPEFLCISVFDALWAEQVHQRPPPAKWLNSDSLSTNSNGDKIIESGCSSRLSKCCQTKRIKFRYKK